MFKWLLASSFVQNMVNDAITHAAVALGAWLAINGFFANCTQAQIAGGACTDYNGYLGSAICLGGLVWKFFENRAQDNTKKALATMAVTGKPVDDVAATRALNLAQLEQAGH